MLGVLRTAALPPAGSSPASLSTWSVVSLMQVRPKGLQEWAPPSREEWVGS
jgi:hypothetical protein